MHHRLCIISACAALAVAQTVRAADEVWYVVSNAQTASVTVTANALPFVGTIDQLECYAPAGVTGNVAIVAVDPYDSSVACVLASNATATGYTVWRPRIAPPAIGGASSLSVTNDPTADAFGVYGETVRAILYGASATNQKFRVRIKYAK